MRDKLECFKNNNFKVGTLRGAWKEQLYGRVLVTWKYVHPWLIFAGKVGAYQSEAPG
jgi:hypothetical protein